MVMSIMRVCFVLSGHTEPVSCTAVQYSSGISILGVPRVLESPLHVESVVAKGVEEGDLRV